MKKHLAVILACVVAVAALAGCAVLYQTDVKYEAALQEATKTLDGVRSENVALNNEIVAAQKTLSDLQKAQEERTAAIDAQGQQGQQETSKPSGGNGISGGSSSSTSSSSSQVGTPPSPVDQGGGSQDLTKSEMDDIWESLGGGSRDQADNLPPETWG